MFGIIDAIEDWLRDLLISMITGNLTTLFDDVNTKVGTITAEVGQTPQGWNAGIFGMVRNLSENVIVPIAGLIITFVLCYELITVITEKNNMHDIDKANAKFVITANALALASLIGPEEHSSSSLIDRLDLIATLTYAAAILR